MKLTATVSGTIPKPIKDGGYKGTNPQREVTNLVWTEYRHQVPVDRGDLRRNVQKRKVGSDYLVGITLQRGLFLHEGTGKYAGSAFDFGQRHGGRVRSMGAKYSEEEIIMFKSIAKRRKGGISIPPDKFADRTLVIAREQGHKVATAEVVRDFNKKAKI